MTDVVKPNRRRRPRAVEPEELERLWERDGAKAIASVRKYDPGAYIRAIARLCDLN